jgi:hypothetical protein
METIWKIWKDQLPHPADQLAAQYPFSGPLQLLSDPDPARQAIHQALFHSFPVAMPAADTKPEMAQSSTTDELIFEPFHTVDYFASQGIKPPSLDQPSDRFGQQLKSFTDWLKVMKRLPLAEVTRQIPVDKEKQVAALAHESLDEKQVWTEAMAEVWIKQGERQKAVRIYQQLSLLDPSKSAYFAAKINELNSSS